MKDNTSLPNPGILKHTATVRDVAAICQVSVQRVIQMIKAKGWVKKGLAKKYGYQWMLVPEVVEIINSRKGKIGNPNFIKGKPNPYAEKAGRKSKNGRKLGRTPRDQPDNLPTDKKKKEGVILTNPIVNTRTKKHIEKKGKTSVFLDED